jgi:hypothetical protein
VSVAVAFDVVGLGIVGSGSIDVDIATAGELGVDQ